MTYTYKAEIFLKFLVVVSDLKPSQSVKTSKDTITKFFPSHVKKKKVYNDHIFVLVEIFGYL